MLLAGTAAIAACSGGSGGSSAAPAPAEARLKLETGPVSVEAAGTPGTLSDADQAAILDVLRRYVVAGTLDPLAGKPVGDLAPLFSPAATPGLTGADRAALVDEGLPAATGRTTAMAPPVALTALSDGAGTIDLVGAALAVDVAAPTARGRVSVKRSGELVLTRTPDGWKIDSYRLLVARDGAGLGTSTTTATSGT